MLLITPGPTNTLLLLSGATSGFLNMQKLILAEAAGYSIAISILGYDIHPGQPPVWRGDCHKDFRCHVYLPVVYIDVALPTEKYSRNGDIGKRCVSYNPVQSAGFCSGQAHDAKNGFYRYSGLSPRDADIFSRIASNFCVLDR